MHHYGRDGPYSGLAERGVNVRTWLEAGTQPGPQRHNSVLPPNYVINQLPVALIFCSRRLNEPFHPSGSAAVATAFASISAFTLSVV